MQGGGQKKRPIDLVTVTLGVINKEVFQVLPAPRTILR